MDEPAPPLPAPAWRVQDGGDAFEASADEPVLVGAERAGLQWPNSCRNGTCRTCMRRLASGEVAYAIPWPGLLAEERADGWILPCVARPRSDLVLLDPMAAHELPVT